MQIQLNEIEVSLDKHMKSYGHINYSAYVSIKYYVDYKANKVGYAITFVVHHNEDIDRIKKYMKECYNVTTIEYESKRAIDYLVDVDKLYEIYTLIKIQGL